MPGEAYGHAASNGSFRSGSSSDAGGLPEDVLEAALAEQEADWSKGKRIPSEERLRQHPALAADPAQGAQVVYHEFVLRQELGESPDWEDYLRRFPAHAAWLGQLRQADEIVEQVFPSAGEATEHRRRFKDYELLEEIGQGGMGIVFKARHRSLDRIVALKMIRAGEYAGAEERNRFRREARAVARLQHANIVQIYEVAEAQGQPFLALEFVDGPSLARRLAGTPLPAREAASLLEALAQAMHYAHGQGIIHRDLKPSNVLLARMPEAGWQGCVPKISDFGLAKRLDRGGDTGSGVVQGTPSYMAAEQAEGKTAAIDQRTDVYGLGAILYEVITGRPPFQAESPLQTLKQVAEAEPARPRLVNPAVSHDLETICLKCLEKDRGRRYASAEALADDLRRFVRGEPIQARPVGAVERGWRWCRRNRVIAVMAAAMVVVVMGGFAATLVQWGRAEANLVREQTAHREAQDNYARLREMVVNNIHHSASNVILTPEFDPVREAMLTDAETCLSFFLQRHGEDPEVRALLAVVLTQQGELLYWQHRDAQARAALQRAADLWTQLPSGEASNRGHAITCFLLERVYKRQGDPDRAQQAFATAFGLWRGVETRVPSFLREEYRGIDNWIDLPRLLILSRDSEYAVPRRFEEIHERLRRIGWGSDAELFLDLLRMQYLCAEAERYQKAHDQASLLAAAGEAGSILTRWLARASLARNTRCHLAYISLKISLLLRRGKSYKEALRLSEQANGTLQELLQETPREHYFLALMSMSWYEIAKIQWSLQRSEETLAACRNALQAQRALFSLAPTVSEYREILGSRYVQLGRKLCELGRLDEAEACFRERQALWPGDAARHAKALQDLQEWAAKMGTGKSNLSAEAQQERRRYLDLYARLERRGIGAPSDDAPARAP